ncbi:ISLre2 family transposase, partial [Nostoc sp. WHI]|nr:ISLre2 family transposase [Nostoc sp. WHI]
MEKNIYANLNFADSLSDFKEDVTKLLELKNIEEWSGRIVKEREETIRQAALVLAGQCIAILLHKLSQSESAHQTAINQTKGWW